MGATRICAAKLDLPGEKQGDGGERQHSADHREGITEPRISAWR